MKIVIIISLSLLAILAAAAAVIITSPTTVQAQAQQQIQLQQPPPTTPATAGSNGNVSILSSSQIRSEFGSTYIVGEVRNDLSDVVQFVQIVGRFYDSNDLLIDTDFTYTNLDLLRPGEKSPFRLIISDESVAQRIDNYTLSVNWDPVFADPSAVAAATVLTIQEGEQRINDLGWYEIVGEVVNGGTDDTEFVKVVATLYDETGRVIDTDFTYTDPTDVPAGQSAPFELTVNDEDISDDIESVKLSAQSQDYFAIDPELATTGTPPPASRTPTMPTPLPPSPQQQPEQQPPLPPSPPQQTPELVL
jgi:hypothetical protein